MNANLAVVPPTEPDALAEQCHAAFRKLDISREQWIEGTLELAAAMLKLRDRYPAHQDFSRWLDKNNLRHINKDARRTLIKFGEDLTSARAMLERSNRNSWELILREMKKGNLPQRRCRSAPTTQPAPKRGRQYNRIPDVMRDDAPPPPPVRRLSDMTSTSEQVDPDFKGTPLQFATKYGHVLLHTKEQIEHHKQQEKLMVWIGAMTDHARTAETMLTAIGAVEPATFQDWLRKSPAKTEKMKAWCESIQAACDAIGKLRG